MPFKNFSMWRGRLPHWRADEVTYYVAFRHRRALEAPERDVLLRALLRPDSRRWDLLAACVLPESTELLVRVLPAADGRPHELSQVVERAKAAAGRAILKRSGERFPPFYGESFDRIVRDETELETRWEALAGGPAAAGFEGEYPGLWLASGGAAP